MNIKEIKTILESKIKDSEVIVKGEGCDLQILIISSEFEEKSTVKRQQLVYSHLKDAILNGEIHAVTMKTYTPEEFSEL